MKSKFYIIANNKDRIELEEFREWSGGEVHIKIPSLGGMSKILILVADIRDSAGVMALALIKDAIDRSSLDDVRSTCDVHLYLDYVPYGRQDRVCNKGEAFGLKVFCNMVNSMNFTSVTIEDPHSDVTPALLDRCRVVSQSQVVKKDHYLDEATGYELKYFLKTAGIVSPDAGSNKKIGEVCKVLGKDSFIRADKKRDLSTGEIVETVVYSSIVPVDCLIVDDLCDGGRTFKELAKALKEKGAERVGLFVTHGIFSRGKDLDYIDFVWSNSDWTK